MTGLLSHGRVPIANRIRSALSALEIRDPTEAQRWLLIALEEVEDSPVQPAGGPEKCPTCGDPVEGGLVCSDAFHLQPTADTVERVTAAIYESRNPGGTWPPSEGSMAKVLEVGWRKAGQAAVAAVGPVGRSEVERLRAALSMIVLLKDRWDAPVESHDHEASNQAWAAVGSEAHKIAYDTLAAEPEVGRSCEVTDEMVSAGVASIADDWQSGGQEVNPRELVEVVLRAALGATADKEAHGG